MYGTYVTTHQEKNSELKHGQTPIFQRRSCFLNTQSKIYKYSKQLTDLHKFDISSFIPITRTILAESARDNRLLLETV